MKKNNLLPIILCGGTGTRLWPLSRAKYPKQYLPLISKRDKSLLQQTVERLDALENRKNPIFICNEEHRFIVAEQIRAINVKPKDIVLEPFARNTAPAIAIAALKAIEDGSDPILFVLAADHVIKNNQQFLKSICAAKEYAERGKLVTFGIVPASPKTGYGYIEAKDPLEINSLKASPVLKFIEKPNLDIAKQLICDPRYTWNSGMFLFKASVLLKEIEQYAPNILKACKEALKDNLLDLDFQRLDKRAFENCPNISIDVAVMEKTKIGVVLPLNADWSDIGSWKSLWEISKKNEDGNVLLGKVITKNTKNLPNINHINTLNYLGEVFGIPGIELNQLNIKKDDTVYLKLHSTKSSSISRMNDMLQNNNYFLSKVRSIQNISDQKTQMEIDLTLKEMK